MQKVAFSASRPNQLVQRRCLFGKTKVMQKLLIFGIALLSTLYACKKAETDELASKAGACASGFDKGLVLGPDLGACPCCGGWFVKIGGDTFRMQSPTYFDTTLALYKMPVPVCIRWEKVQNTCVKGAIKALELKLE
jgi:hypothetical protein